MTPSWQNWAGNQVCRPTHVHRPRTTAEIAAIVRHAAARGEQIRVVGGGHSWTPLVNSDDHLISLDDYNRIRHVDRQSGQVTVEAGIRLRQLNRQLAGHRLGLSNMGSTDAQSLAGALSTGTHGTGLGYGILATQVVALELIDGGGDLIRCSASENHDIFAAARCGLGVAGILSTLTLQCEPAYRLQCVEEKRPLQEVLDNLDAYLQENEYFKFYWLPYGDVCLTSVHNRTELPRHRPPLRRWFDQHVARNYVYEAACRLSSRFAGVTPTLNRLLTNFAPKHLEYVDAAPAVFTFPIFIRHWESELAIPVADTVAAIHELRAFIESKRINVNMTVEFRFVDADDIWLSPAYGRQSCFVDLLLYRALPYDNYFGGVEALFAGYKARPHWGKLHTRKSADLAALYPRWADFDEVRRRLDPGGVFLNPYLGQLFEGAA